LRAISTYASGPDPGQDPGSADGATSPAGALAAVFVLGIVLGMAVRVLSPREVAAGAVLAAFIVAAIALLRRRVYCSGQYLMAGDFSYRGFFQTSVEGIFRTTPDGHYLNVNPALARIYGYETEEQLKVGLTNIASQLYVDPRRRDEFKAIMDKNDEVVDFVSEIRRRDGSTIWISENARAVRNWNGVVVCYQGTVEDITAKIAAERAIKNGLKRAEEANRTKNAFLAMMSHELKTPLNAILGFSEMISGEMLGPIGNGAYLGYVRDIHASGTRLLAIINDVLDVARLEGDSIVLNRCECSAGEIAEAAIHRARVHTGDPRPIELDIPGDLPTLDVDKLRLAQVLANLLSNALKFTPTLGTVALRAFWAAEGGVHFAVADSGIGMSDEAIAMVLQPFHQADATLARRFEGAGLGLPIAHALTMLHGGTLAIASTEGKGTTVTVELPAACLWRQGPESEWLYA